MSLLQKCRFFTGLCWNFEGIASGRRRLWIGLRLNKFCRLQHPRRIKAIIFRMVTTYRSSHPEVFYEKCVLKICSKCTREHPCRSMVFSCKFTACFLNAFPRNTSAWLLLYIRTLYWEDYCSFAIQTLATGYIFR